MFRYELINKQQVCEIMYLISNLISELRIKNRKVEKK